MEQKLRMVFIHSGNAALPELQHYERYFSKQYEVKLSKDIKDATSADIVWLMMGSYRYKGNPNQVIIKEFPSLSLNPFGRIKNIIKTLSSFDSDIRIYLSDMVRTGYYFPLNRNVALRDMGVANNLSTYSYTRGGKKLYDLIYVGDMSKSREIDKYIIEILSVRKDIKIGLVGNKNEWIVNRLSKYDNIDFIGYVPQSDLYKILDTSKAAINIIPDKYPYNIQTSTKLQEYAAFGIPIVTTVYDWSSNFLSNNGIPYVSIEDYINGENPKDYDVNIDLSWERIIKESKIEDMFLKVFSEKNSV